MLPFKNHSNIKSLWDEYIGANDGVPGLRDLEARDKTWRNWTGGKQRWSENRVIYQHISQLAALHNGIEDTALKIAQQELDSIPRRSNQPNWNGYISLIKNLPSYEEASRKRQRTEKE
jgi:hypothetical protein